MYRLFLLGEDEYKSLGTPAVNDLLYQPQMTNERNGSFCRMRIGRGN
jgi:hypothetical protein